jgi:hypothetical protein
MLTLRQKFNLFGGKDNVRSYVAIEYGDYPLGDEELWDVFTSCLAGDIMRGAWIRSNDESQPLWVDGISLTVDTINRIANTPGRDLSRYLRLLKN